jgi:hypothetical protein
VDTAATDAVCVGVFPMIVLGNCASTTASRANPAMSMAATRVCVRAIEILRVDTISFLFFFGRDDCPGDDGAKLFRTKRCESQDVLFIYRCVHTSLTQIHQGGNPFRESCLFPLQTAALTRALYGSLVLRKALCRS